MLDKEKDLMERYIYEVIKRVPKVQRDEIKMELEELISDMYEGEEETMESVLMKLGNPTEFAKKYRDENNFVISPGYYDNYIWVLKIVLICAIGSVILSIMIGGAVGQIKVIDIFSELLSGLITGSVISFGFVTLIFAILERQKVKIELKKEREWSVENLTENINYEQKTWSPKQLAPVPDKRGLIKRSDSIAGIIFLVIFCGLLIFAPRLFGAYSINDNMIVRSIPLFNMEKWGMILPVLILSFFVCFIDEMIKLVIGCYGKIVMISRIVCGFIQIALMFIAFKVMPIWNPNFIKDVVEDSNLRINNIVEQLIKIEISRFSDIILAIIILVTFLEIGVTVYKSLRYGSN